jgi:hypothetical protein
MWVKALRAVFFNTEFWERRPIGRLYSVFPLAHYSHGVLFRGDTLIRVNHLVPQKTIFENLGTG